MIAYLGQQGTGGHERQTMMRGMDYERRLHLALPKPHSAQQRGKRQRNRSPASNNNNNNNNNKKKHSVCV